MKSNDEKIRELAIELVKSGMELHSAWQTAIDLIEGELPRLNQAKKEKRQYPNINEQQKCI